MVEESTAPTDQSLTQAGEQEHPLVRPCGRRAEEAESEAQ